MYRKNINEDIYYSPSFYVHILSALVMLVSIVIFYNNYTAIRSNINIFLIVIILFAILLTLHSMSHMGLEFIYNYNPL